MLKLNRAGEQHDRLTPSLILTVSESHSANGVGIKDLPEHPFDGLTHTSEHNKVAAAANAIHEINGGLQSPPAEAAQLPPLSSSEKLAPMSVEEPFPTAESLPPPKPPLPEADHLASAPAPLPAEPEHSLPATTLPPVISTADTSPPDPPALDVAQPPELIPESTIKPQPVSDLREPTGPISEAQASEIREEKQERDLKADPELSNSLALSDSAPIPRTITPSPPPQQPSTMAENDAMDTTEPADSLQTSDAILPHHPATPSAPAQHAESKQSEINVLLDTADGPPTEPLPPSISQITASPTMEQPTSTQDSDHIMQDVPASSNKVARSRDEEEAVQDEPATKRTKTDDDKDAIAEFKMPDAEASQPTAESIQPLLAQEATQQTVESAQDATQQTAESAPEAPTAATSTPAPTANGTDKLAPPGPRAENPVHKEPMTTVQQKYIVKALQSLRKSNFSNAFAQPVDYVALAIPTYPDVIKKPMDLKTLDANLRADKYPSVADVVADFDQIVNNATTFNGPDHFVTQQGYKMAQAFERHLEKVPGPNDKEPEKPKRITVPKLNTAARRESRSSMPKTPAAGSPPSQTFAVGPTGVPLIRRDSNVMDGRPKREIHPPAPRDLQYDKPRKKKFRGELEWCKEVMEELSKPRYTGLSWPFQTPVDPVALNIPNYHRIIKKPMDISTIEKKLKDGQYENAKEFHEDWKLMFGNCFKFNPPSHDVHQLGKQFEEVYDEKWKGKAQWIREHAPPSGPQSPDSSDAEEDSDEDEEVEEEPDANTKTMDDLQRQIEMMQKQMAKMREGKTKGAGAAATAPAKGKKKGRAAAKPVKETKKGGKVEKKQAAAKRGKKAEKVGRVTFEMKQAISKHINNLPPQRMAACLDIIRRNVPEVCVCVLLSVSLPSSSALVLFWLC